MKSQALLRRWKRRYRKLETDQWRLLRLARRRGSAEDIHELRVTLRRLRLLLRIGRPAFDRPSVQAYRAWARQLSLKTSPLRDLDVAIEWLDQAHAPADLLLLLARRRTRLWKTRAPTFRPPPARLRRTLRHPHSRRRLRTRLAARLDQRWLSLRAAIQPRILQFFSLPLADRHTLRRQLRSLRYLRELQLASKRQASDPLLRRILRLQVAMGELQNLLIVRSVLTQPSLAKLSAPLLPRATQAGQQWIAAVQKALPTLRLP